MCVFIKPSGGLVRLQHRSGPVLPCGFRRALRDGLPRRLRRQGGVRTGRDRKALLLGLARARSHRLSATNPRKYYTRLSI